MLRYDTGNQDRNVADELSVIFPCPLPGHLQGMEVIFGYRLNMLSNADVILRQYLNHGIQHAMFTCEARLD